MTMMNGRLVGWIFSVSFPCLEIYSINTTWTLAYCRYCSHNVGKDEMRNGLLEKNSKVFVAFHHYDIDDRIEIPCKRNFHSIHDMYLQSRNHQHFHCWMRRPQRPQPYEDRRRTKGQTGFRWIALRPQIMWHQLIEMRTSWIFSHWYNVQKTKQKM